MHYDPCPILTISVYPDSEKVARQNYPIDIRFGESQCVSNFERVFDMMKMSFIEKVKEIDDDIVFRDEFRKDPEGYIERALKTPRP